MGQNCGRWDAGARQATVLIPSTTFPPALSEKQSESPQKKMHERGIEWRKGSEKESSSEREGEVMPHR